MYGTRIEVGITEYAHIAEQWFLKYFTDKPKLEERVRIGYRFLVNDNYEDNRVSLLLNSSSISPQIFQSIISGGESFDMLWVSILWDRLLDSGILIRFLPTIQGIALADHRIHDSQLFEHLADGTFLNLFRTPARLPERYAQAVCAVDVTINGSQFRGTGFIVKFKGKQYFVTCRHNIDPDRGVIVDIVSSSTGECLDIGKLSMSDRYDISVAPLRREVLGPCFSLSDNVEVFDEVFTLGYPRVPRADTILLGHKGEMNGRANLYLDKCPALIISNLVSPGSSGGPVITRAGRCVGMTINWLEGQWGEDDRLEKMRFSAALPAALIREVIEGLSR